MAKQRVRAGDEVVQPGADADHHVRGRRGHVRRRSPGDPYSAKEQVAAERALARICLGDGNTERLGESCEVGRRVRVADAAAGDDQRSLGAADRGNRPSELFGRRRPPADEPRALGEERTWIVVRLSLYILGQRDGHGARIGRIEQHPHRLRQSRENLLGPRDRVEVATDGPKTVVDREIGLEGCSRACSTGPWRLFANVSDGNNRTGRRFTVAVAAPETRLVEPGPIDAEHASVASRLLAFAYPIAVWTIACSFFGW